ncbi:uncharacterized protein A4U43_C03F23860 [Asparagus officinalis]|uniref:Uncharacterized protein n=1 Tax=Asparagus officinalis TaxID=4686 RepID=A0A5P1FGT4_ASPOF|nr:uncharacterized protein A4U43_C03F23860 [Asparagus officinalis]
MRPQLAMSSRHELLQPPDLPGDPARVAVVVSDGRLPDDWEAPISAGSFPSRARCRRTVGYSRELPHGRSSGRRISRRRSCRRAAVVGGCDIRLSDLDGKTPVRLCVVNVGDLRGLFEGG